MTATTLTSPESETAPPWGLALVLFGLATLLGGICAVGYGYWSQGSEGILPPLVAVAVCSLSGVAALLVSAWPTSGDGQWSGAMSAILIRSGLPLVAVIGVTLLGGPSIMQTWGLLSGCVYLWFLAVETCLSVAIVSTSSQNPARESGQTRHE